MSEIHAATMVVGGERFSSISRFEVGEYFKIPPGCQKQPYSADSEQSPARVAKIEMTAGLAGGSVVRLTMVGGYANSYYGLLLAIEER